MADVEMKPLDDKSKDDEKDESDEKAKTETKKPPLTPVEEIKANAALIDRAVATLEPRFTHRVLRTLTSLRKRLDDKLLRDAIVEIYLSGM